MNGNMEIIIAVAKLSRSHPAPPGMDVRVAAHDSDA